ncbi:hypothetical protein C8N24_5378 [Solirubrobacter pauli]|uniref:Uncharacterized protein n=1 Tax=Solirubrobacter pauli TaxID=166793 RepID=A0A660L094_9ACTN|nr:hypothetical protein [Solirubrobacter pauli]RKQ87357.1 hypothetical protein C8N24_5378 [Solirubrobacter pauli]
MNLKLVTILGGTLALTGAIAVLVFWILGRGEAAGERSAEQFASALVHGDAGRAPDGGAPYVQGVRDYYEGVRGARVLDVRRQRKTTRMGRNKRTRSNLVAEVHVDTGRGPAVLELVFRDRSLVGKGASIKAVHELLPRDVRDDSLSDAQFVALAKAFQHRDRPANNLDLSGRMVRIPDSIRTLPQRVRRLTVPQPAPSPQLRKAYRQMRCVKRAKGDVEKLARCVS